MAEFTLGAFASKYAARSDVHGTVTCLTRVTNHLILVLFALNRTYPVNDKTALAEIAEFECAPPAFGERVNATFARLGSSADELRGAIQVGPGSHAQAALGSWDAVSLSDGPGSALRRDEFRSGLAVAVRTPEESFGVLCAYARMDDALDQEDGAFLKAVANVLASAISRRRMYERVQHQALHDPLSSRSVDPARNPHHERTCSKEAGEGLARHLGLFQRNALDGYREILHQWIEVARAALVPAAPIVAHVRHETSARIERQPVLQETGGVPPDGP